MTTGIKDDQVGIKEDHWFWDVHEGYAASDCLHELVVFVTLYRVQGAIAKLIESRIINPKTGGLFGGLEGRIKRAKKKIAKKVRKQRAKQERKQRAPGEVYVNDETTRSQICKLHTYDCDRKD